MARYVASWTDAVVVGSGGVVVALRTGCSGTLRTGGPVSLWLECGDGGAGGSDGASGGPVWQPGRRASGGEPGRAGLRGGSAQAGRFTSTTPSVMVMVQ